MKLVIVLLLLFEFILAIDTGKLAGKVLDQDTGEPLPGANIIITENSMGVAANEEGKYLILKYLLSFTYV